MQARNTIQKQLVMDAMHALAHPTADEVYAWVSSRHSNVSRGTVYRNLNLLVMQSMLRKVLLPDAADRFDITLDEHHHIRCRECGVVADVSLPHQKGLLAGITDASGFLVETHDILLSGLCPQCRKNRADAV